MEQWQWDQLVQGVQSTIEMMVQTQGQTTVALLIGAASEEQRTQLATKLVDLVVARLESGAASSHWIENALCSDEVLTQRALAAHRPELADAIAARAVKEIGKAEVRGYGSNDLGNTLQQATREAVGEIAADVLQTQREAIREAVAQKLSKMIVEKAVADHARSLLDAALKEPE